MLESNVIRLLLMFCGIVFTIFVISALSDNWEGIMLLIDEFFSRKVVKM